MKLFLKGLCSIMLMGSILPSLSFADDLLKQAFQEAQDREYASQEEGDDILGRKSIDVVGGLSGNGWLQGPITSRVAQFMLRMVVVLAIPMLLYSGITIMLARGDESKLTEALKHVGHVVLGVFLALASVMIVLLLISLTNTNLGNI